MNPSDAGGEPSAFDVWASIVIPSIGIVIAVAIPLIVLYWQRRIDDARIREERDLAAKQLADERALAHAETVRERRRLATREALENLAPFIGLNPFEVDMHPLIVRLRSSLIALVDEYPADHPINDLVGNQHHYGMTIGNAILDDGPPARRANVTSEAYVEALLEQINPLSAWAAYFTSDLRVVQAGDVTDEQIRLRSEAVRAELDAMHESLGKEPAPPPNLRRPMRQFPVANEADSSSDPTPDRA